MRRADENFTGPAESQCGDCWKRGPGAATERRPFPIKVKPEPQVGACRDCAFAADGDGRNVVWRKTIGNGENVPYRTVVTP